MFKLLRLTSAVWRKCSCCRFSCYQVLAAETKSVKPDISIYFPAKCAGECANPLTVDDRWNVKARSQSYVGRLALQRETCGSHIDKLAKFTNVEQSTMPQCSVQHALDTYLLIRRKTAALAAAARHHVRRHKHVAGTTCLYKVQGSCLLHLPML